MKAYTVFYFNGLVELAADFLQAEKAIEFFTKAANHPREASICLRAIPLKVRGPLDPTKE